MGGRALERVRGQVVCTRAPVTRDEVWLPKGTTKSVLQACKSGVKWEIRAEGKVGTERIRGELLGRSHANGAACVDAGTLRRRCQGFD